MAERPLSINYSPLDLTTEIRLLILGPGSGADPIQCLMYHTHREDQDYQALSYEWGNENCEGAEILVNGESVQIRNNLYQALRHIRDPLTDLYLWIDAICINQADLEEKSHQVALMGYTFATAINVIAWLGVANDDSDIAMDWMANSKRLGKKLKGTPLNSPERKGIVALCRRSYWRRIWIIQELYLSKDYVVQCGTKVIPRQAFGESVASLNSSEYSDWKEIANNHADEHRFARQLQDRISDSGWNCLFRWLKICLRGDFQFSNEYDLIYALVGISDDCKSGALEINYQKPLEAVYLDAMRLCRVRVKQGYRAMGEQVYESRSLSQDWLFKVAKKMGLEKSESLPGLIQEVMNLPLKLVEKTVIPAERKENSLRHIVGS
ncbi:hypothetical protein ACHAPT_006106 [Fusarium lateritium]